MYDTFSVLDGNIVVMGGVDSAGRITEYMHEYNHSEGSWKVFGELPRPLKSEYCLSVAFNNVKGFFNVLSLSDGESFI